MSHDPRARSAPHYDLFENHTEDVEFYRHLIPTPNACVLELGCGTGRVLVPLVDSCAYIHGLDHSRAMLANCLGKLAEVGVDEYRARVECRDICDFVLERRFDLITAPFRVMQNLETDAQVQGMLSCIRRHLSPTGTCILNAFNPIYSPDKMRQRWVRHDEQVVGEVQSPDDPAIRTVYSERRPRMDADRLILYPELIYRRYVHDQMVEETRFSVPMRCWYPSEFERLIVDRGFRIVNRWGGYKGEVWGEGPELVIQFCPS